MAANELATRRQHRDLIDVRHRALREYAVTAALHRYPWLDRNLLNVFTGLGNLQRNSVAFGQLVSIHWGRRAETRRPFALLLPDVILDEDKDVPVLADTDEAACALGTRYPKARIAVPEGPPPWPLYRYRAGRTVPAGTFGNPKQQR